MNDKPCDVAWKDPDGTHTHYCTQTGEHHCHCLICGPHCTPGKGCDMTTETLTLTGFLLARIAEDEAAMNVEGFGQPSPAYLPEGSPQRWDYDLMHVGPARWLAECAAKRAIVEDEHFDGRSGDYIEPWCATCSEDEELTYLPCPTLRILAAVYADHPDYRDEWRVLGPLPT